MNARLTPDQHHRRIRRRARGISWVLGPALAIALAAWFAWSMVVCQVRAENWELAVCQNERWLPTAIAILIGVNLVMLVLALIRFSEDQTGVERPKAFTAMAAHARDRTRDGYDTLEVEHRDIVFRSLEATGWSIALGLAVLVFHRFELAPPLALLIIAFVIRVLYGLARWGHDRFTGGTGGTSSGPSGKGPDSLEQDPVEGGLGTFVKDEEERVVFRRAVLGSEGHPAGLRRWALAISGGGIRSATFGLGVLQGLACAPVGVDPQARANRQRMLKYIDYLSTVSGGGYIGAFFCSLFIPGRVRPDKQESLLTRIVGMAKAAVRALRSGSKDTPEAEKSTSDGQDEVTRAAVEAAQIAYDVIAYEPPGRYRGSDKFKGSHVGKFPLAWLRDNGRYLMPTGGGDTFFAASVAIRNWVSLQFIIGTVLLTALALVALGRCWLSLQFPEYADLERHLLDQSLDNKSLVIGALWWSPILIATAAIAAVIAVVGVAFWIAHPMFGQKSDDEAVWPITSGTLIACLIWSFLMGFSRTFGGDPDAVRVAYALAIIAWIALAGAAFHFVHAVLHAIFRLDWPTIRAQRLAMTRYASLGFAVLLAVTFIGLMDTIGQTLYLATFGWKNFWASFTSAGAVGVLVWVVRKVASNLMPGAAKGKLAKRTIAIVGWIVGLMLLLSVMLLWQTLVHWIQWQGGPPLAADVATEERFDSLHWLFALALAIAFATGKFAGFINLSSLQSFYGSRLCRAYLGASNGERFSSDDERSFVSVSEPHPKDDLAMKSYYGEGSNILAPIHIVNVTMNQTVDRKEQLVQRDRKGRPLAVVPSGFTVDGVPYRVSEKKWREISRPLSISEWVGTSGAAFSTGLGRATSAGVSLALGLANVRLGRWWESTAGKYQPRRWLSPLAFAFTSQTYLLYELTAQFHGLERRWQYLSDGGHFENTGLYELLRPERAISFIVACDDGADPGYEFGDLANLIRLARIDLRAEVEIDRVIAATPKLSDVFGVPEDFRKRKSHPEKCAVLLKVRYLPEHPPQSVGGERLIVLLKPNAIASMDVDLGEYARTNPLFPQEPTADQFFDEAQWESYRKLGKTIVDRVFGEHPGVGLELWGYLHKAYPHIVGSMPMQAEPAPVAASDGPAAT